MGEVTEVESKINDITENRKIIQGAGQMLLDRIERGELAAADCPVTHMFSPGLYLREIFMPAGASVVGKIHTTEHFNIILKGRCTVVTANEIIEVTAPFTFISKAGVQKVVIVHEDCVWQVPHVTEKTDLKEIEREVIVENYESLLEDGLIDNLKRIG